MRLIDAHEVCKYNGWYGAGVYRYKARYDTTNYVYIDYMLKEVR